MSWPRRESPGSTARCGRAMSVADDPRLVCPVFAIEDMWVGVFSAKVLASGFGQVGDGRSFAFRVEGHWLLVEIYRRGVSALVPQPEDVVDTVRRNVRGVDITDERSLAAVVRDTVDHVEPASNPGPFQ